jgi:hypothetical protein
MAAAEVNLEIDQGEDWACQIVWTDSLDAPQLITDPARLDAKDKTGATVLSLQTPASPPPDGTIPEIAISNEMGLIQLYVDKATTGAMVPGQYLYDLFVTANDGDAYAGNQTHRLMAGTLTVNKRTTVMT